MGIAILIVYTACLLTVGAIIVRWLSSGISGLQYYASAFLLGTVIGVPLTYLMSCLFVRTGDPILWGSVVTILFTILFIRFSNVQLNKFPRLALSDVALLVISILFGTWLMTKTFHAGANGQLFVGSNNIFDFGLAIGLIRSLSWGSNIPLMSPFFSGLPYFYHFLFIFWVAIWEHLGVGLVWAMNIPSVLSFGSLLIMVYYLPQNFLKQGKLAGWIAVLLTVTHSTLTFWFYLLKNGLSTHVLGDVWRMPTYPFAGPFDGSTISIFMTLNNYVNQRHLAFSIAAGFCILLLVYQIKNMSVGKYLVTGFLMGLLLLWNIPITLLTGSMLVVFMVLKKDRKNIGFVIAAMTGGILVSLGSYISEIPLITRFLTMQIGKSVVASLTLPVSWTPIAYLWQNLGILPFIVIFAVVILGKRERTAAGVFIFYFVLLCATAVIRHRGFDQKFLSFLIICMNTVAAAGIVWAWKRKNLMLKIAGVTALCLLTISGFIDLIPVKNEFAYPLVGEYSAPVVAWIKNNTPKDAIFVSYSDMIDPVVLAGRKNYFGFYGNIGWFDRSKEVASVYAGDTKVVKEHAISYILVPKQKKNDFPYIVNLKLLTSKFVTVYEDKNYVILSTNSSRPAITVINLIRGSGLGHKNDDLLASLKDQWQLTKEADVPATWLFQYGALEAGGMTEFAKNEMQGQEFGLLFEIDRNYAEKAHVQFRGQGEWYFSDGLLLSSYDQSERRELIDTAFSKFKEIFGYYPKTVGAWWIGGDSLSYMQKKYGITSALRAADQYNLDFYSIWGTPWNVPYLSSETNEGIPAASFDRSSKVVILQWALRDPLKGYSDPLYSLQDYRMKGYTSEYVNYLSSIYLQQPFGNFVMGLENGGTLEALNQSYKVMLTKVKEMQTSGIANILLSRDFAKNYLEQQEVFAGRTHFLSTDFNSNNQSFWYISENYRATIFKTNDSVSLVDLRNYTNKTPEDFDILPNSQPTLRINESAIIDSMRFPAQSMLIKTTNTPLTMKENGDNVELYAGNDTIAHFTPEECIVYPNNSKKIFNFKTEQFFITPLNITLTLYILYFVVIFLMKKNIIKTLKNSLPLLLPLLCAIPFLMNNTTFLFDKKETIIFNILFSFHIFPVIGTVYIGKIFPFFILLILHFVFTLKKSEIRSTIWFYIFYVLVILQYFHFPYFPLDKTTYPFVVIVFVLISLVMFLVSIFLFMRNKSKSVRIFCVVIPFILLGSLAVSVMFSRSKIALTVYEIQALQFIKDQQKSVIYVEQVDNLILPIYKAVKPVLYSDNRAGQRITGKPWEMIMRPENNVLKLSDYDKKIIVIPRYLGSDISEYEITTLHLKKIFDNAQIAIFEKI